jgi:hypothetical protein
MRSVSVREAVLTPEQADSYVDFYLALLAANHRALSQMRKLARSSAAAAREDVDLMIGELEWVLDRVRHWEELAAKLRSQLRPRLV